FAHDCLKNGVVPDRSPVALAHAGQASEARGNEDGVPLGPDMVHDRDDHGIGPRLRQRQGWRAGTPGQTSSRQPSQTPPPSLPAPSAACTRAPRPPPAPVAQAHRFRAAPEIHQPIAATAGSLGDTLTAAPATISPRASANMALAATPTLAYGALVPF